MDHCHRPLQDNAKPNHPFESGCSFHQFYFLVSTAFPMTTQMPLVPMQGKATAWYSSNKLEKCVSNLRSIRKSFRVKMPLFFQKDNPLSALGRKMPMYLFQKRKRAKRPSFYFFFSPRRTGRLMCMTLRNY